MAVAKAARDACEKISPEPVNNGNPIRFIRDSLVIDEALISRVGENTGARIVFCAREVALAGLSPSHDVLIAADELKVEANAATSLVGSPSVTVLAARIDGALQITSAGVPGEAGLDGEPGESGVIEDEAGGRPMIGPGGPGGPGGDGGAGTAGGTIKILYGSTAHTPTGSAPGGPGGPGGRGGAGGAGRPRGRPGSSGKPGAQGASGTVEIRQVGAQDLAGALDEESRKRWAAYRAEVEKATSSPV
ncbi:MAG TPA: hypothetical protein VFS23_07580 [Vicinamibacterales bacterium]|nr:hypothetical protein [Vicinamibacterales bacterium]